MDCLAKMNRISEAGEPKVILRSRKGRLSMRQRCAHVNSDARFSLLYGLQRISAIAQKLEVSPPQLRTSMPSAEFATLW